MILRREWHTHMAGFTETVESLMKERGNMSLRALSARVNYDSGGLSRIIAGKRRCPPALARLIDDALDAGGEVIEAAAHAPEPPPDAEKIRRALEDTLAEGMMSADILSGWESAALRHGYRTRDVPAPLLLADITADLAELRLAIERHRAASALPRLALTAARMSGLVCLTLIKMGDRQAWRRWGHTSRHAASEAADQAALSWATAQESYGFFYAGDMPGAVECARAALGVTSRPTVGGVLAAALEMRAHAVMGDAHATMIAMDTAERMHAGLADDDLAASAFGYAESQLRFHAGDALTRLGDTAAAFPVLDRALALCAEGDYTDWSLIRFNRAACMIRDGNADAGIQFATGTLLALDVLKRRGIITDRARELAAVLTPAARASKTGRDYRGLLDEAITELPR